MIYFFITKKKENDTQAVVSRVSPLLKSIIPAFIGSSAPSQKAKRKVETL